MMDVIITFMRSTEWSVIEISLFFLVVVFGLAWVISFSFQETEPSEAEKVFHEGNHEKALTLCKNRSESKRLGKLAMKKAMEADPKTPQSQFWWEVSIAYFAHESEPIINE